MNRASNIASFPLFLIFLSIGTVNAMRGVDLKNAAHPDVFMPIMGIGVGGYGSCKNPSNCCTTQKPKCWWSVECPHVAKLAVLEWLKAGGRRVDGANSYRNQESVREAILQSAIERSKIFLVSKVGPGFALGFNETLAQAENILSELGVKYVDLLLIHWPVHRESGSLDPLCAWNTFTYDEKQCRLSSWRAMLAIWKAGKARAVGVSNYNTSHLQEIEDANLLMPAVNQVPFNPHLHVIQRDVKLFCESRQIVLNGYSPLGAPDAHSFPSSLGMESSLLDEPSVRAIAKKHGRSPAEIIIAWQVSQGVWVNPRTSNPEHMKENLLAVSQPPLLSVADVDTLSSLPQDNCQDNPLWYECEGTHGNNGVLV